MGRWLTREVCRAPGPGVAGKLLPSRSRIPDAADRSKPAEITLTDLGFGVCLGALTQRTDL